MMLADERTDMRYEFGVDLVNPGTFLLKAFS